MKSKSIGVILAFLVWSAGSTYWYVCKIKGFCATQNPSSVLQQEPVKKQPITKITPKDLLYYNKNEVQPQINNQEEWTAEIKSIAQLKAEGKKLRIEAPYYQDEHNPTTYDNLGLARAEAVKKLFTKFLDTSLILTQGKLEGQQAPDIINAYKNRIHWITFNNNVKEINGKTLIYFPVNSTREIKNKAIINYLNELAAYLKKNPNYRAIITGYTDNTGDARHNQKLGLLRAQRIQKVLVNKGVNPNNITVKSEGENNPIADNNTIKGRQKNRRVEIEIIKK